ncbi:sulfite exporter TauE/SafE family protein [soil metagenome]
MDLLYWSALTVGFFGSFHCVGMCGPLALALPNPGNGSKTALLTGRILYNSGRVITYAILGLMAGLLGLSISMNGWQRNLSIISGILIILSVLITNKKASLFLNSKLVGFSFKLKKYFGLLLKKHNYFSLFGIGLLNGILPCGFVYLALAASVASGNPFHGMLYMLLFGTGTIPMMMLLSLTSNIISIKGRTWINRFSPVIAIVIGLLLIQRGYLMKDIDSCHHVVHSVNTITPVNCK